MIDIKGITKSFGSLQVLKGIDLHIDKGEVVSMSVLVVPARLLFSRLSVPSTNLIVAVSWLMVWMCAASAPRN